MLKTRWEMFEEYFGRGTARLPESPVEQSSMNSDWGLVAGTGRSDIPLLMCLFSPDVAW